MNKELVKNRYDFVFYFDVENGNPNGDPDAGNMPRIDPETGIGIVTDVCLKRKIRNYIELLKNNEAGFKIFIKDVLNNKISEGYDIANENIDKNDKKSDKKTIDNARNYMCNNYYDIRTFGAVMSTGKKTAGTVTGPVQLSFGSSVDPIFPQEITISRMAKTDEKDERENVSGGTLGKKNIIPYGLYRVEGHVMAAHNSTGFTEEDLELLWMAIINMFENDFTASRGKMAIRKFIAFKHESALGNYPSNKLLDLISVKKINENLPPRKISDYEFSINLTNLPNGITAHEFI